MADTDQILQDLSDLIKQQNSLLSKQLATTPQNSAPGDSKATNAAFSSALDGLHSLGGATTGLTSAMTKGGTSISGSASLITGGFKNLVGNMGSLGKILGFSADATQASIQYLQDQVTVYRELSKVGLGLSGDIGLLGQLAGKANMSLGPFAQLVAQNKDLLIGFTGGLDGGTKAFAGLLHEFAEGTDMFQRQFMTLGYTVEESNQLLARNLIIQRRSNLMTGRSDQEQLAAAASLNKELSALSKLTGEEVTAIQDKIIKEQMAGDNLLMVRQMEMQGFAEAGDVNAEIIAKMGLLGDEYVKMYMEFAKNGTLVTQESKDFANANREGADIAFAMAMSFRNKDAEAARTYANQLQEQTLMFQRSQEFAEAGQKAFLGGAYAASAKQIEKTYPIHEQIDRLMKQFPDMSEAEAIAKALSDARERVEEQINEGAKDGALSAVIAVEQETAKALGVLNETASSIVRDSTELFSTVRSLSENAIETLRDAGKFTLEAVSATEAEMIKKLESFKMNQQVTVTSSEGKTSELQITEKLIKDLRTYIDPTTPKDEVQRLKELLTQQGALNARGDIAVNMDKVNMETFYDQIESYNPFQEQTKQVIQDLKDLKEGTVEYVQEKFPEIYKLYQNWFEDHKKYQDWYMQSTKEINEKAMEAYKDAKPFYQLYQQDDFITTPVPSATGTTQVDAIAPPDSTNISKNVVPKIEGTIDLVIPSEQIIARFESPNSMFKSEVNESDQKTTSYADKKNLDTTTDEGQLIQAITDLGISFNKSMDSIKQLASSMHNDNSTIITRLDSLLNINSISANYNRKMTGYFKELS